MYSIEDVNSRTILQQFHALYENQKETNETVEDIESDLAQEIQDRTNADSDLADSISSLQNQLDSLGTIFTLKGSVATVGDLPQSENHVGDVYYVVSESTGYIWIDDNGTERWEQLGISVDLSNYVTTTDLATTLEDYQGKLTAGTNVSIIGSTISATQPDISGLAVLTGITAPSTATIGIVGQLYLDTQAQALYQCIRIDDEGGGVYKYRWGGVGGSLKQSTLTAGTNINIDGNNVISASGGLSEVKASDVNSESATAGQVLTANGSGGASFGNVPAPTGVYALNNAAQQFTGSSSYTKEITMGGRTIKYIGESSGHYITLSPKNGDGIKVFYGSNSYGYLGYHQLGIYNGGNGITIKFNKIIKSSGYTDYDILVPSKAGTMALLDDITAKVPDAPSTDGTYTLKCVVSNDGATKTYQWVLDTQSSNLPVPDNTASGPSD